MKLCMYPSHHVMPVQLCKYPLPPNMSYCPSMEVPPQHVILSKTIEVTTPNMSCQSNYGSTPPLMSYCPSMKEPPPSTP